VLCQSYASMPWCLVTDIDYVTLDYLHSRVFTESSFVSAIVDGILCRTVVDSAPKPSAENIGRSQNGFALLRMANCAMPIICVNAMVFSY
jgi:hypothetical protein